MPGHSGGPALGLPDQPTPTKELSVRTAYACDLPQLLEELEREWVARAPAVADALRPPATAQDIDDMPVIFGLDIELPEEARTLWRWHNGQRTASVDRHFLGGVWFYSLEKSAKYFTNLMQIQKDLAVEWPDFYRPYWIPVFNISQDSAVIDCRTGEVLRHTSFESPSIVGRQPSLSAVVRLWLRAMREGAWLFPEAGVRDWPDVDEDVRRAIGSSPDDRAFI